MRRLTDLVLRRKALVAVFWLVAMVAGGATSSLTAERMSFDFSLPGQPGYETERQLLETYGTAPGDGTTLVAVTVDQDSSVAAEQARVDAVFTSLQSTFPDYRVAWRGNAGPQAADRFTTTDGRTAYGIVVDRPFTGFTFEPAFRATAEHLAGQERRTGFAIRTTGFVELLEGSTGSAEGDGGESTTALSETLLGAAGALVVLLFVFASFLAFVPLLIAAVSILSTLLCVLAVSYLMDVSIVVQFLIALVGLGLAIDYSLLVVTRWREERGRGADDDTAVREAMRTAGHAVLASAGTVAISLIALVVVPMPFLQSMGVGGALIPLVSAAVVLTLLPAVLASIGPRVDWPRLRHEESASTAWTAWGRGVVRHRWLAAGVGTLLVGLLVVPVLDMRVGQARTDSLASSGPAVETLQTLRDGGVAAGLVTPLEVLVRAEDAPQRADEVVQRLEDVPGVAFAVAPDDPSWRLGDSAVVHVVPQEELVDIERAAVVAGIRDAVSDVPGVVGVAGPGAAVLDYRDAVFGRLPLVLGLIGLTTFLLLVRTLRSVVLPLKAVLLNVVSVAATFGFLVLFWQHGLGSEQVFGVSATGAAPFWLPVIIFAFLFGLSMDYEVFILTRMREEYDRSGSTSTAVVEGLGRTGRLVTCAALILFLAFSALATAPGTDVRMLATALGVGILIDATILRALLVPAVVSLLGSWNWWLPAWLARPLRVAPSSRVPEVALVLPGQRAEASPQAPVRTGQPR